VARLPQNLRDRLKRIQNTQRDSAVRAAPDSVLNADLSAFTGQGWVPAGDLILRREIECEHITLPVSLPALAGMMPGIDRTTAYEDLLFFDLETSGLSHGAGTVAFLAAFGRLVFAKKAGTKAAVYTLHITQYLLLDYPGEYDFVAAMAGEFSRGEPGITMISYNGKCFDSQILKTRCLMNGMVPPEYRHVDLLYPARRLWKRILPDCAQGTIETNILGLDRTGDIPGAMAPDIWFSFLKHGETEPLWGICEHNRRDIAGLAAMFAAMLRIAGGPFAAIQTIHFDLSALAFRYAINLLRAGNYDTAREWLIHTAAIRGSGESPEVTVLALRALAIDSEHRLKNPAQALPFTEQAMKLLSPESSLWEEFNRRKQRLCRKLAR
jgi:uncharacterized protein YprB with RNaseH-like and TPR domain